MAYYKCGDCIHADVCEEAETLVGFSRDNPAYCGMFLNSADVAPVRRGRWIVLDDCANEGLYCSECKKRIYKKVPNVMPNFCSNCGSDMRNVNDNPEMLEEYRWEMTR